MLEEMRKIWYNETIDFLNRNKIMFGFFKKDKAVEVEVPTQVPAHIGHHYGWQWPLG